MVRTVMINSDSNDPKYIKSILVNLNSNDPDSKLRL